MYYDLYNDIPTPYPHTNEIKIINNIYKCNELNNNNCTNIIVYNKYKNPFCDLLKMLNTNIKPTLNIKYNYKVKKTILKYNKKKCQTNILLYNKNIVTVDNLIFMLNKMNIT